MITIKTIPQKAQNPKLMLTNERSYLLTIKRDSETLIVCNTAGKITRVFKSPTENNGLYRELGQICSVIVFKEKQSTKIIILSKVNDEAKAFLIGGSESDTPVVVKLYSPTSKNKLTMTMIVEFSDAKSAVNSQIILGKDFMRYAVAEMLTTIAELAPTRQKFEQIIADQHICNALPCSEYEEDMSYYD